MLFKRSQRLKIKVNMAKYENPKYSIDLSFEEISLPPFKDILVVAKDCIQGKIGLSKSFELLLPNSFEIYEIADEGVEAIFINKRLLKKITAEKIVQVLRSKVFPFISEGEILKVDVKVLLSYSNVEI